MKKAIVLGATGQLGCYSALSLSENGYEVIAVGRRNSDGTLVQRDWYSSFLLYCYDYRTQDIDKDKCITDFGRCFNGKESLR